jgi:hypothetical protein
MLIRLLKKNIDRKTRTFVWHVTYRICGSNRLIYSFDAQPIYDAGFDFQIIPPYLVRPIPLCWVKNQWQFILTQQNQEVCTLNLSMQHLLVWLKFLPEFLKHQAASSSSKTINHLPIAVGLHQQVPNRKRTFRKTRIFCRGLKNYAFSQILTLILGLIVGSGGSYLVMRWLAPNLPSQIKATFFNHDFNSNSAPPQ